MLKMDALIMDGEGRYAHISPLYILMQSIDEAM